MVISSFAVNRNFLYYLWYIYIVAKISFGLGGPLFGVYSLVMGFFFFFLDNKYLISVWVVVF